MQTKQQTESLKVALYIRVSTEEQAEKYGPGMQKEALFNLVKSKGKLENGLDAWTLAGEKYIYVDDGVSGTISIDERPAFARLIEDLTMAPKDNKPFDIVAVYKIDRFARKLKILLDTIDFFEDNEIKFISANESIDTTTPFGKAILGIIGVIAELERETIIQRTTDGRNQAIRNGIVVGTSAIFGYIKNDQKRLEIFEKEAEVVRMIFDLFVNQKKSAYEIATHLRNLEIPSPEASAIINKKKTGEIKKKHAINFWHDARIRAILQDEIYIGNRYYDKKKQGKAVPKGDWKLSEFREPQIVDNLIFEKAQILAESYKHEKKTTGSGHTYLLSGLLKCDSCHDHGSTYDRLHWTGNRKELIKGTGNFTYSYMCSGKNPSKGQANCKTIPLPGEEIEKYVIGFAKRLLKNPIATFNHQLKLQSSKSALKQLEIRRNKMVDLVNGLPIRRERIREQHSYSVISGDELKRQYEIVSSDESRFRKELSELEQQLAQNSLSVGYQQSLELFSSKYRDALEDASKNRDEVYTLLHTLIEEIIVYCRPAKETDKIAGKRKEDQMIPHRLHIKLKLPQDIIQNIRGSLGREIVSGSSKEFQVENCLWSRAVHDVRTFFMQQQAIFYVPEFEMLNDKLINIREQV